MSKESFQNIACNFWTLWPALRTWKAGGREAICEESTGGRRCLLYGTPPHSTEDSNGGYFGDAEAALLGFWIHFLPSAHNVQGAQGCLNNCSQGRATTLSEFSTVKHITMFLEDRKGKQRGEQILVWVPEGNTRWWGWSQIPRIQIKTGKCPPRTVIAL